MRTELLLAVNHSRLNLHFVLCSYDQIYPRNVTELSYRITSAAASDEVGRSSTLDREATRDAHVYISYQSRGTNDADAVCEKLASCGYHPMDLGNNEMVNIKSVEDCKLLSLALRPYS